MIGLADVRDWLKTLALTDATWSIGRYEANKEKRVCVYTRADYGSAQAAIGGSEATKTEVKHVSVVVHWNRNHKETEVAALALYDALKFNPRATIGGTTANGVTTGGVDLTYIDLQLPEPQDVGSDENGIYERVIWIDLYFEEG